MSFFKKIFHKKEQQCLCNAPVKSLSEVAVGQSVQIKCLRGEEATCQRMREMGFCESSIVEKMSDSGALICRVCDSKIVLSQELAQNVIVKDICQLKGHKADSDILLLSQMSLGQRGIITDFVSGTDDCERIEEMGVTPGEEVEIVRWAPLGDPIEIKIRGYCLSLRKQEAEHIKIKLL